MCKKNLCKCGEQKAISAQECKKCFRNSPRGKNPFGSYGKYGRLDVEKPFRGKGYYFER